VNTPLGIVTVYRYASGQIRRQIVGRLGSDSWSSLGERRDNRLVRGCRNPESVSRALLGGLCLYLVSTAFATIPHLLPWEGWRRLGLTAGSGRLGDSDLGPSPEEASSSGSGGNLAELSAASEWCRWIAGGELSLSASLFSPTGFGLLVGVLGASTGTGVGNWVEAEFTDELHPTAEFVAAAALKEWRRREWVQTTDVEDKDEDEDEELPAFLHPAPEHRDTPVSTEFREVMARQVRRMLDLPEPMSSAGNYLAFRAWAFRPLHLSLRWAALGGFFTPLLFMASLLVEEHDGPGWSDHDSGS